MTGAGTVVELIGGTIGPVRTGATRSRIELLVRQVTWLTNVHATTLDEAISCLRRMQVR